MKITLKKSTRKNKKYMVIIDNEKIHFGADGYSDYTKHKDDDRKKAYIARHKKNENWKKSGIMTAGFWSRWLLWNKKTIKSSIDDIEKRFNIDLSYKKML
jgi:hypothetical protein